MTKAVLFDLDGTLLDVDMEYFLPHYLKRLAAHFAGLVEPETFVPGLLASTQAMIENLDPDVTNKEAFYQHFCSWMSHPVEKINPLIHDFYQNIFPQLEHLVRRYDHTPEVMAKAKELGYSLVLATNPIFPLEAIYHRMSWAGLNKEDFALITSYESMHFSKPHPQYYLEIAEKIDTAPQDCLMIGNDVDDDIAAAAKAGMKTFLVENLVVNKSGCKSQADFCGRVEDIPAFLEKLKGE
ncbi:MAG: HAD family hydrolase [Bacillota bacterium]|nr:HAD family hydrolase [Bacillota bacterium]MDW7683595.1 HAD family hydrolase [Bacillota bacterium]